MTTPVTLIECGECCGLGAIYERGGEGHACLGCDGTGRIPFEPYDSCESCGNPSERLEAVEESDSETGYYAISAICHECRLTRLAREAGEYPAVTAAGQEAAEELGWLSDVTVRKPMTLAPIMTAADFAEREARFGGGA